MKKTTLLISIALTGILMACSSAPKKSLCECYELAANGPETDNAPAGCEWIGELSQKEQEELGMKAIMECTDLFDDIKNLNTGETEE